MWEGRAAEQLGGYLVSSQGQPITEAKSIRWREILENLWELSLWTMWTVQNSVMFFCFGSKTQEPFM